MLELSTLTIFTSYAAVLSYALGVFVMLPRKSHDPVNSHTAVFWAGTLAALLHATTALMKIWIYKGWNYGFFDALSLTALIVVITSLITRHRSFSAIVMLPIYAIAAICVLLAAQLGQQHTYGSYSLGMTIHMVSSIVAYALLCLATLYAVLLWLTENQLREHSFDKPALPPMQQTEKTLFYTLHAGWTALSCAIITGFLFIDDFFGQHLGHKTLFSLISWFVLGALVLGHWRWGWRGKQAAAWTIGGFLALVIAYFGSKFVLDVILNRL